MIAVSSAQLLALWIAETTVHVEAIVRRGDTDLVGSVPVGALGFTGGLGYAHTGHHCIGAHICTCVLRVSIAASVYRRLFGSNGVNYVCAAAIPELLVVPKLWRIRLTAPVARSSVAILQGS